MEWIEGGERLVTKDEAEAFLKTNFIIPCQLNNGSQLITMMDGVMGSSFFSNSNCNEIIFVVMNALDLKLNEAQLKLFAKHGVRRLHIVRVDDVVENGRVVDQEVGRDFLLTGYSAGRKIIRVISGAYFANLDANTHKALLRSSTACLPCHSLDYFTKAISSELIPILLPTQDVNHFISDLNYSISSDNQDKNLVDIFALYKDFLGSQNWDTHSEVLSKKLASCLNQDLLKAWRKASQHLTSEWSAGLYVLNIFREFIYRVMLNQVLKENSKDPRIVTLEKCIKIEQRVLNRPKKGESSALKQLKAAQLFKKDSGSLLPVDDGEDEGLEKKTQLDTGSEKNSNSKLEQYKLKLTQSYVEKLELAVMLRDFPELSGFLETASTQSSFAKFNYALHLIYIRPSKAEKILGPNVYLNLSIEKYEPEFRKGFVLLEELRKDNIPEAWNLYGICLLEEVGVMRDEAEALKCFAHFPEHPPSALNFAKHKLMKITRSPDSNRDDNKRMCEQLYGVIRKEAEAGNLDAICTQALLYEEGYYPKKDIPQALKLYQIASDKGHIKSTYRLGCYYYQKGNINKAISYLKTGAEHECVDSIINLIAILINEKLTTPKNEEEANHYIRKLDPYVLNTDQVKNIRDILGKFHGGDTPVFNETLCLVLKRMAVLKNSVACVMISEIYMAGMYGEKKNFDKAKKYVSVDVIKQAQKSGYLMYHEFEKQILASLKEDSLSSKAPESNTNSVLETKVEPEKSSQIASKLERVRACFKELNNPNNKVETPEKECREAITLLETDLIKSEDQKIQSEAQYILGQFYLKSSPAIANKEKAIFHLKAAAELQHEEAYCAIASCYKDGHDIKSQAEYFLWVEKALNSKVKPQSDALVLLAGHWLKNPSSHYKPKEAISLLLKVKRESNGKNKQALNALAVCKLMGWGEESKNPTEAFQQFEKQSKNFAEAQNNLGWCLLNGIGTEKDCKKAIEQFKAAITKGSTQAIKNLAWCYLNGLGIDIDLQHAQTLFNEAKEKEKDLIQEQNNGYRSHFGLKYAFYSSDDVDLESILIENNAALALKRLAECYLQGCGVTQNAEKAQQLFKKASELLEKLSTLSLSDTKNNHTKDSEATELVELEKVVVLKNENTEPNIDDKFEKKEEPEKKQDKVLVQDQVQEQKQDQEKKQDQNHEQKHEREQEQKQEKEIKREIEKEVPNIEEQALYTLAKYYLTNRKIAGHNQKFVNTASELLSLIGMPKDMCITRSEGVSSHSNSEEVKGQTEARMRREELFFESLKSNDDYADLFVEYAKCCLYGIGRQSEQAKGMMMLSIAAHELNHKDAYYHLGWCHEFCPLTAAEFYKKAASLGHAEANLSLGWFYDKGLLKVERKSEASTPISIPESAPNSNGNSEVKCLSEKMRQLQMAYQYYEKAALLGNADAMFNLGTMYEEGEVVPHDVNMAIEWYSKIQSTHAGALKRLLEIAEPVNENTNDTMSLNRP